MPKIQKSQTESGVHYSTLPAGTAAAPVAAFALILIRIYYESLVKTANRGEAGTEYIGLIILPIDFILMSALVIILALTFVNSKKLSRKQIYVRLISCAIGILASISFQVIVWGRFNS